METGNESDKGMMKVAAKALLATVEDSLSDNHGNIAAMVEPLVLLFEPKTRNDFIADCLTPKKQEGMILDMIRSAPKNIVTSFFSRLHPIIEAVVTGEEFVPPAALEQDDDQNESEKPQTTSDDDTSGCCLSFLKYSAMCTEAALERTVAIVDKNYRNPIQIAPQVYEVALQLHNVLLSLHDCGFEGLAARNAVLSLCESWWLANAMNRDLLIAQVLPLQVLNASDPTEFQKSNIKKLLSFKDAFQVIDFVNPSSDSLRSLLLRIASNPLCLKLAEGRKFLASLFRDQDLILDLHLSFRVQIPNASKTILQAYADIYQKAWCDAEDANNEATQEIIEHNVLQDLMHAAIHVASPAMAKALLIVLEPLHKEKKDKRVAELLWRLYSPILWRSLTAANPMVRKNAVTILGKVFPLNNPTHNQMRATIETCSAALETALKDADPRVRVAASEATANVCALFWEALPSTTIRMLINHVVMEHSSDISSAAVRAQALLTIAALLDVPQSHAVLRPLLPSLGNLVHDKAEKVRLSAVRLLRRIKTTPGIHFYHVVPVDHLSARFSEEQKLHRNPKNIINRELTALMLNSYFPQGPNITASDQLQRTVAFIMTDPSAAVSFYANLAEYLEIDSVAKFIIMLLSCLKSAVDTEQAQLQTVKGTKKKRSRGQVVLEPSEQSLQTMSASNASLMVGLSEAICTLLESIQGCLMEAKNEACKLLLRDRLREANLPSILAHFEQKALAGSSSSTGESNSHDENFRVCRAILRGASCVYQDCIPEILDFVSDSLEAISNDGTIASVHVSAHLSLLASWGMVDDLARVLAESLESIVDDSMEMSLLSPCLESNTKTRKRSGRVNAKRRSANRNFSLPSMPPKFACSIINDMLCAQDSSLKLRERIFGSTKAIESIQGALRKAMNFIGKALDNQTALVQPFDDVEVDTILSCCEAYGRFALHQARQGGNDQLSSEIQFVIDWTTNHVVPVLINVPSAGFELQDLDLSRISNASDSLLLQQSPCSMSPPKQRANLGQNSSRRLSDSCPTVAIGCHSFADVVARLLMQSSCLVLSEFLICDDSYAKDIDSFVSQWCSIFEKRDGDEGRLHSMKEQLLPCFVRLAVQCCKSSISGDLFKTLLIMFDDEAAMGFETIFKEAAKSLLHGNVSNESVTLADLSDQLLRACYQLVESKEPDQDLQTAKSLNELWSGAPVRAVLDAFSTNTIACQYLADKLWSNIRSHHGSLNKELQFHARCLSFLITKMTSDLRMVNEMNDATPRIEDIQAIMGKFIDVTA